VRSNARLVAKNYFRLIAQAFVCHRAVTRNHKEQNMSDRMAMSPAEAAQVAGIGTTLLREEIAAGRLTARKVGARVLIAVEDLRAWLDNLPKVAA
jgi:excisionase family DNA binding protein